MSTHPATNPSQPFAIDAEAVSRFDLDEVIRIGRLILKPFASLRLTVVLFALGIFIVLIGTLAQTSMNMWDVREEYFHAWFSWVPFQVFFPPGWFPKLQEIPGGFYFLGGETIGLMMVVNLLAAHLVRFKIQARGGRLAGGLALMTVGAFVTLLVIVAGQSKDGMQAVPLLDWLDLWKLFKGGVTLLWLAAVGAAAYYASLGFYRSVAYWVLAVPVLLVGGLVAWMIVAGEDAYLGDSGMRILWQLIQALFAAGICLAGCWLVFKKRAGIVLLHSGIGLIMFGEFLVSLYAVESRISMFENETATYAEDSRLTELAIVDKSDPKFDEETTVPERFLREKTPISDPRLAFDIVPVQFMENSQFGTRLDASGAKGPVPLTVRETGSDFENPATKGAGLIYAGIEAPKISGTDMNQTEDFQAAYVTLRKKSAPNKKDGNAKSDDPDTDVIGTYLVSRLLNDQKVEVDGKTYYVSLRYKRIHKPFAMRLNDVQKNDYMGTSIPMDYSSDIQLIHPEKNIDRSVNIWMNNPLRYAGETYYQSGYQVINGRELTTLAVVTNAGWMIPYVGCMLVATGLLAHFGFSLTRFLRRQMAVPAILAAETSPGEPTDQPYAGSLAPDADDRQKSSLALLIAPILILALGAFWIAATAVPPRDTGDDAPRVNQFAKLPIVYQGRVKPFDTLALNSLRIISEKASFRDENDKSQPPSTWLVDVISHSDRSLDHKVFRIENFDVLHTLGLTRRKGFRYSYNELTPELDEFKKQVRQARGQDKKQLNVYQKKLLELDNKVELFLALRESHRVPDRDFPDNELPDRLASMSSFAAALADSKAPRAVPSTADDREWEPLTTALTANWIRQFAASNSLTSTDALADELTSTLLNEQEMERLVDEQIVTVIEGIVRSRNPELKGDEAREFARNTAKALPPHMRDVIQPAARREVEQKRAMFLANLSAMLTKVNGGTNLDAPQNEAATAMGDALVAYRKGDTAEFNDQLQRYEQLLAATAPEELKMKDALLNRAVAAAFGSFYGFEAYFNSFGPFETCGWLYLLAFVVSGLGLLAWRRVLNRTAFALISFTFIVHTFALIARVYLSGRPPVTNLYSSAVFIGWGCVLLAIILELFFRNGIGNLAAAIVGFLTLRVAYALAGDGDTFVVLQAVLDTQFWLATHVVCITLGYATALLAGGLGVIYVLRGVFTPSFPAAEAKDLCRMIYGVLCFAIFFSFVGTVLGGLWADDSWGRFWGWDPKENGALIIVLWIALVLHARWAGLVKQRGLAVLAVAGNITTAWSWFGVNELGVGLHSYGFTEGILQRLSLFVLSQLIVIIVGCLPLHLWWSQRDKQGPTATA